MAELRKKGISVSVKVVGLDRAVGQELKSWHFSVGAEYLLLQFTGGECCQIAVQRSSSDDPWLEESRPFNWREYDEYELVRSGVLTAEWVATQNAEMVARREAEQRANELEILAALKAKYEGEVPVTANLFRGVLTRMKAAVSSCPENPDNSPTTEHSSVVGEIADDLFPLPKTLRGE